MAFLDNSGDIILDAVLTDAGRARLAKGDGSFRIVKFALGDDEINYRLYNKAHASGSAYYDLEIMQTPVLEAFTNNTSSLKNKLISLPRTNLLYLPILKLNNEKNSSKQAATAGFVDNAHAVAVDEATEDALSAPAGTFAGSLEGKGILHGENLAGVGNQIIVDQGLDTTEISSKFQLDSDLVETQYVVRIDNRLGSIASSATNSVASVSFIDDDNIASYYFSSGTDSNMVSDIPSDEGTSTNTIQGPRGTRLSFKIRASLDLNTSTHLFTEIGSGGTVLTLDGNDYKYIDSNIRVTGATTGYAIDIPVRFLKKVS